MKMIVSELGRIVPDPKNPRRDFGDLDALAASFVFNEDRPGEPMNPIVVVPHGHRPDGEPVYRIVDGERRYRAMRKVHAAGHEVACVLCESTDEAAAMVAMLTTDDKAHLTDEERSRGVQQMLLLDVPYERVERAARLQKGQAAKVKLGAALAGEKSMQMSLDRLMAMTEFERDSDAMERLRSCGEHEWRYVADSIRRERRMEAAKAEFADVLADAGVEVADEDPPSSEWSWKKTAAAPGEVAGCIAELGDADIIARICVTWTGMSAKLFVRREGGDHDGAAALNAAVEDMRAACDAADAAHREWFGAFCRGEHPAPETCALIICRLFCDDSASFAMENRVRKVEGIMGEAEPWGSMGGWVAALAYSETIGERDLSPYVPPIMRGNDYCRDRAREWLEALDAMEADGYGRIPADDAVEKMLASYLDETGAAR